ncbi:neutral alpha-glucosidase C [Gigaspora margarita]|uniref:Neutral alpha-glucosidase C n=1 Tax=Gigaspora margarita TaxID=4874 RepID=A0A8H3X3Z4_GIGMA|nr:neutral alpha-glucosidase C [Gigaspora margarita]
MEAGKHRDLHNIYVFAYHKASTQGLLNRTEPPRRPFVLSRAFFSGAFQPFFRGHAHRDTKRREPWLFGDPYTSYIRDIIKERYLLLPLWYTLFYEASKNGMPIIRPML